MGEKHWILPAVAAGLSGHRLYRPEAPVIDADQTVVVPIIKPDGSCALAVCLKSGEVVTVELPFLPFRAQKSVPLQMNLIPGGGAAYHYNEQLRLIIGKRGIVYPPLMIMDVVNKLGITGLTAHNLPYEYLYLDGGLLYMVHEQVLLRIDLQTGDAQVTERRVQFPQARPEGIYFMRDERIFLRKRDQCLDLGDAIRQ
jgi:hypothetical protein